MCLDLQPRADNVVIDGLVTLETAKERTIKEAGSVKTVFDEEGRGESYLYGVGLFGHRSLYKHTHDETSVCPECGATCRVDKEAGEVVCGEECGGIAGRIVVPKTDIDGTHTGSTNRPGLPVSIVPEPDVQ